MKEVNANEVDSKPIPYGKLAIIVTVALSVLTVAAIVTVPQKTYEELCPQRMSVRTVTYKVGWLTGIVESEEHGDERRTPAMEWIVSEGYAPRQPNSHTVWIATTLEARKKGGRKADCHSIVESLSDRDWVMWSNALPDRGREFWTLFVSIARRHHYKDESGAFHKGPEVAASLLREVHFLRVCQRKPDRQSELLNAIIDRYEKHRPK